MPDYPLRLEVGESRLMHRIDDLDSLVREVGKLRLAIWGLIVLQCGETRAKSIAEMIEKDFA